VVTFVTDCSVIVYLVRQNDRVHLRECLDHILVTSNSFTSCCGCISKYLSCISTNDISDQFQQIDPIFSKLAHRFSSAPEHVLKLKMLHLKSLLSILTDDEANTEALRLCDEMVSDVADLKAGVVSTSQVTADLQLLLIQRVRFFRAHQNWTRVLDWSHMLQKLMSESSRTTERVGLSEVNYLSLALLHKCDALLQLKQDAAAAVTAGLEAVRASMCTPINSLYPLPTGESMVLAFKAVLQLRGSREAVETLICMRNYFPQLPRQPNLPTGDSSPPRFSDLATLQCANETIREYKRLLLEAGVSLERISRFCSKEDQAKGRSEWLRILILCSTMAWDARNSAAVNLLLQLWLYHYFRDKCWRSHDVAANPHLVIQPGSNNVRSTAVQPRFFSVLLELLQNYVVSKLSECLGHSGNDVSVGDGVTPLQDGLVVEEREFRPPSSNSHQSRKRKLHADQPPRLDGEAATPSQDDIETSVVIGLLRLREARCATDSAEAVKATRDSGFVMEEEVAVSPSLSSAAKETVVDLSADLIAGIETNLLHPAMLALELLTAAESDSQHGNVRDCIGTAAEIKWVADVLWNVGLMLVTNTKVAGAVGAESSSQARSRPLTTAALLLEHAEKLYHRVSKTAEIDVSLTSGAAKGCTELQLLQVRCLCLTLATASRLDVDSLHCARNIADKLWKVKRNGDVDSTEQSAAPSAADAELTVAAVASEKNLRVANDNITLCKVLIQTWLEDQVSRSSWNVSYPPVHSSTARSLVENPMLIKTLMIQFAFAVACKTSAAATNVFLQVCIDLTRTAC
jgi:hypothetical protein